MRTLIATCAALALALAVAQPALAQPTGAAKPAAKTAAAPSPDALAVKKLLEERFPGIQIKHVAKTPYFGLYEALSDDQMLYVDLKTWLPDDLLVKADKMTMANAQELRVPFLDHRLVELAARLPVELKLRRQRGKAILRDASAGVVPDPILERSKKGFPVPTRRLLRELGGFCREVLLDRTSACRSWFDRREVERILADHASGRADREQEIWTLLVFELWHGLFVARRRAPSTHPAPGFAAAAAG